MRSIIIYGGAFNPPTNAHLAIVKRLSEKALGIDAEIWLLLSGQRRDKQINVSTRQRLAYAKALVASAQTTVPIRIITDELFQKEPTETYNTVQHYEKLYPNTNFIWVFGSDSIQTMLKWNHGEWLYRHCAMWIIDRPGYELTEYPPRSVLLAVPAPEISSTLVRERLSRGESISDLVPSAVGRLLV